MPQVEVLNASGNVINTINADAEFAETQHPGRWRFAAVQPAAFAAPTSRKITRLAFLTRFTDAEAVQMDLASVGATPTAAGLRRAKEKTLAATFIDLERADTRAGVLALEAVGLLAAGRALTILDGPIQENERF